VKLNKKAGIGPIFCWFSGLLTLAVCLSIIVFLLVKGVPSLSWRFLTTHPEVSLTEGLGGGILGPLAGTLLLTVMGILVALPWALAMAIYLAEYAGQNWWTDALRLGIEVLAGVPTIVIALFGLILFSYPELSFLSLKVEGVEQGRAFGKSFFAAAITMAVMVLPLVTKTVEEALKSVPPTYREAAYALGTSKWHTIKRVILPAAKSGIATGAVLGLGRIAADVAIVWFCLGAVITFTSPEPWWDPGSWLDTLRHPGATLTSYIYSASPAGTGNDPQRAYGAALVLIALILVLNGLVDYLQRFTRIIKEE
jgi:phosphate transport system permease protein